MSIELCLRDEKPSFSLNARTVRSQPDARAPHFSTEINSFHGKLWAIPDRKPDHEEFLLMQKNIRRRLLCEQLERRTVMAAGIGITAQYFSDTELTTLVASRV